MINDCVGEASKRVRVSVCRREFVYQVLRSGLHQVDVPALDSIVL